MVARQPELKQYYDDHVPRKLRDYIYGNLRVDAAWQSISSSADAPRRVLEVGCGIGYVSARMKSRWPAADIAAVDLSPTSIEVAERLFGDSGVRFECGRLEELGLGADFDLIVLMDLYEHIETSERADFHASIGRLMAPDAVIFLSFPTPEYQAHLRENEPQKIQPVDEDVTAADLERFADDCGATLEAERRLSVWRRFDYAHAWLRRDSEPPLHRVATTPEPTLRDAISAKVPPALRRPERERRNRVERVTTRLGAHWVDAADQS